jgi:hypothetical protein
MSKIKRITLVLTLFVLVVFGTSLARATTYDFDSLATPSDQGGQHWGVVPTSYGGLNWSGWEVANGDDYKSVYSNSYTAPSSPNFAYNGDGALTVTITGSPFNFLGAYFSPWAQNNGIQSFSSQTVKVEGYSGAILVNSDSWNLEPDEFVLHTVTGFDNIDKLVITSDGNGRWFAMDNFEYTSTPVPEPATMLLLGSGLLGIWGFRRKFRK